MVNRGENPNMTKPLGGVKHASRRPSSADAHHHRPLDPGPALKFSSTPLLLAAAKQARSSDPEILALWLRVHRATVLRWADHPAYLSIGRADALAIRIGLHPIEIWPHFFDGTA